MNITVISSVRQHSGHPRLQVSLACPWLSLCCLEWPLSSWRWLRKHTWTQAVSCRLSVVVLSAPVTHAVKHLHQFSWRKGTLVRCVSRAWLVGVCCACTYIQWICIISLSYSSFHTCLLYWETMEESGCNASQCKLLVCVCLCACMYPGPVLCWWLLWSLLFVTDTVATETMSLRGEGGGGGGCHSSSQVYTPAPLYAHVHPVVSLGGQRPVYVHYH